MGGSEDDGAGPVQQFGGVEDSENDEDAWLGPLGQPAIECEPPLDEGADLSARTILGRNPCPQLSLTGARGRRRRAGLNDPDGVEPEKQKKHHAEWHPVNEHHPFRVQQFVGTPGPTYADEEGGTRSYQESLKDLKRTKFFFSRNTLTGGRNAEL